MTVVVILSVFLLCFLQCYLGETAKICQPGFVCVSFNKCEFQIKESEVLYPCQKGEKICCPTHAVEKTTVRYEPFNTIRSTISQSNFDTAQDGNGPKENTYTNHVNENIAYHLNKDHELTENNHKRREENVQYYNGNSNSMSNNNEEQPFSFKSSNNKVNGALDEETDICGQNFVCIPLKDCDFRFDAGEVLYPCINRSICCPKDYNRVNRERTTYKYQPFNTINPILQNNQNNFHDDADNVEDVRSSRPKTSQFDNIAINHNMNKFDNYNNANRNNSSIKAEEYSHNDGNNIMINNPPEFDFTSSNTTTSIHNVNKIGEQELNRNRNIDSRPEARYDSDRIIFNLPDYTKENNIVANKNRSTTQNRQKEIFSDKCGISPALDKITGGQIAEIGQFPWMALLGFKHSISKSLKFLCGGSLITRRYVLTAAHCILENHQLELHAIRLGEYNLTSERDCFPFGKKNVCADYIDVAVDRVAIHPKFNSTTFKNDIAIIRLKKDVELTDYINTICLPFEKDYSNFNMTGQNFTVSGWGKSSSGDLFGTNVIEYAKVTTWNPVKCNNSLPPGVKPLSTNQFCANGAKSEDACKGDSGGPLVNVTLDKDLEVRHIQFGIVSFGSGTCGDKNLPTVYTRVDKYLQWILKNIN